MKRHNLPLGPLALEGERKRREVPAYVGHKLHVHHAGHDSTHDCAVILPLGVIGFPSSPQLLFFLRFLLSPALFLLLSFFPFTSHTPAFLSLPPSSPHPLPLPLPLSPSSPDLFACEPPGREVCVALHGGDAGTRALSQSQCACRHTVRARTAPDWSVVR